jgi:uncharacterized protein (TIGR00369 family)
VQTFLPYADFRRSAEALDQARLGKQRVETLQMLRALRIPGYGWANHPAVTMWRGHVGALVAYGLAVTEEWVRRGHADTVGPQIAEFASDAGTQETLAHAGLLPGWLGDESLHRSHRSALVRKDPGHYRPLFGDVPGDLESAGKRQAVGVLDWAEERCTVGGVLHGGALMSLGDTVGAVCAFLNLPPGAGTATLESKSNLFRPVRSGTVRATSQPLHVGRTVVVVQTDLRDDDGRLVAQVTQTQAVLPAPG